MGADSPDVSRPVQITVTGEIDLCTSPALEGRVLEKINPGGPDLIIDLSQVRLFSAAGITVLVTARQKAASSGIGLSVVASSRVALLPLAVTGVDAVLDLHPDLQHALEAPGRRGAHCGR